MKICPFCAEVIQDEATICHFCKRNLQQERSDPIAAGYAKPIKVITCPRCGSVSPESKERCDCGFEFKRGVVEMDSTQDKHPESVKQIVALRTRYTDAYRVARTIVAFANIIKGVGLLVGALIAIYGLYPLLAILARDPRLPEAIQSLSLTSIVFIVCGCLVGLLSYLMGVLVSAQGQILLATLDSAVNTSPLLDNSHRAGIMSLPK
jgi:hypothetical protein